MPKRKADSKNSYNKSKRKRNRIIVYSSSSSESEDEITTRPLEEDIMAQVPASPRPAQDELPDLDPELLSALGDSIDEKPVYGENIHQSLAQRWSPILRKGLPKDIKEKLLKEYNIPENCKLLKAPTLNPEIKAAVSEMISNRDKTIQTKQDQLGVGLSALNKAITLLLLGDDKLNAIKILSDGCRILSDLHYMETQVRTKFITSCLDKSFAPLIKDHERDETLFGEKLSDTIKASKAIERQGLQIKKPAQRATSLPANTASTSAAKSRFLGNERGPPRYASASRGGREHTRAPAAYRRPAVTTTPTRQRAAASGYNKHRAPPRR